MASQYTKDITQSKVYKKATGQDEKLIDEIIGGLGVVKKFADSRVADNIKSLQEDKTFDVQNKKNQLMQLNQFSVLEQELQDTYGGDLESFSRAKAKELLDQRALINFPVGDTEKSKLTITHPDEAYGQTLIDSANAYKTNFTELRKKLGEAGIPYTADATKQGTFIDNAYQAVFNKISRANNFNVIKGMGSLFRGQGLDYSSAEDLKRSYNQNIAESKLSDIEDLNNQFKAIYNFDAELGNRISQVVKKADVRKDVTTTFGERQKRTIIDSKGQERKQNYVIMRTEYVDKDGNPQIDVVEKALPDDPYEVKLSDVPTQVLYSGFLKNVEVDGKNALDEYQALLADGYTPRYAYEALDPKFKKSYSEIEFDNFYKLNMQLISDAFQQYQKDYYFTQSVTGVDTLKKEVSDYFEGKGPKPSYVYASQQEFAASLIDVKTAINKENIIGGTVAVLDYGLSSGADWQEYMNSFQGRKDILKFKDDVVPNEAFVEELKNEFRAGDRTRVDNFGNYFPTTGITGLNTQQLQEMGLGSTFKDTQQLGYNVNRDTLVMRNYGQGLPTETPPPAEEETTIGDTAKAVFDFAKDFVIGEELSLDDALWLIPGAGIAVNIGRRVITKGFTTIAPRILKSKDTQKAISELNKIQNKTRKVRKTTKRRAKSGPNKGEMIEVKVKGQGPKNFKDVPSGNPQYFNFKTQAQFDTWFEGLDPLKKALVKSMKTVDNKGVVSYGKNVDIKSFSKELGNIKGSKVQLKMPGGSLTYTVGTGGAVVKSGAEFATMEDEE